MRIRTGKTIGQLNTIIIKQMLYTRFITTELLFEGFTYAYNTTIVQIFFPANVDTFKCAGL